MWKGYEEALGRYGVTMCAVWVEKGFADTCEATIRSDLRQAGVTSLRTYDDLAAAAALPEWLFDPALLRSHQSALVRKDPDHYRPLFPGVPDDIAYVWPMRSPAVVERERRRQENGLRREARAREKAAVEEAQRSRRRSAAARRGWVTRTAGRSDRAPGSGSGGTTAS
jgi:hypothetical protein